MIKAASKNQWRILLFSFLIINVLMLSVKPAPVQGLLRDSLASRNASSSNLDYFVKNEGQFDPKAQYMMRSRNVSTWLVDDSIWFTLLDDSDSMLRGSEEHSIESLRSEYVNRSTRGVNIKLSFAGSNPHPKIEPFKRLATKVSYLIGGDPNQWRTAVSTWGAVRYKDLYPGIDLVLTSVSGKDNSAFSDWYLDISAGGDPSDVRMIIEGAQAVELTGEKIEMTTEAGIFSLPLLILNASGDNLGPFDLTGRRSPRVFSLGGDTFTVTAPFTSVIRPRGVIDQITESNLDYSTYLGGSSSDNGSDIAVDESGAAYVVGTTQSTDFPVTTGAYNSNFSGKNVFVVKIAPNGGSLDYAAVIGGSEQDFGNGIAVENGIAYVTGDTLSDDFPIDQKERYFFDAFALALDQTGTSLIGGRVMDGNSTDYANGIGVEAGSVYVTGETWSQDFAPGYNGNGDAYVVKLGSDFQIQPNYPKLIGGSQNDVGFGITVKSGEAYVTGLTRSYENFPANGYQGDGDAFITKVSGNGDLVYTTLFGGILEESGNAIAINEDGVIYITGQTKSPSIPSMTNTFKGVSDAFVAQFDQNGILITGRYVGGSGSEEGLGIGLDHDNLVYLAGGTGSVDFPTTAGAIQTQIGGLEDAFLVKVGIGGMPDEILYGSYLGGDQNDSANGLALDQAGALYLTGSTKSTDFPVTSGAVSGSINGGKDAFTAKVLFSSQLPTPTWTVAPQPTATNTQVPGASPVPGLITTTTQPTGTGTQTPDATHSPDQVTITAQISTTGTQTPDRRPIVQPTEKLAGFAKASPVSPVSPTRTQEGSQHPDKLSGTLTPGAMVTQTAESVGASREGAEDTSSSLPAVVLFSMIGLGVILLFGILLLIPTGLAISLWYFVTRKQVVDDEQ